jgi:hypothetical protein
LKLLLDEHYSAAIAEQLRARGHDVRAVQEVPDLREISDPELLEWAAGEGCSLVTENVQHFMPLHNAYVSEGRLHAGLVFSSPKSMPRSTKTIGAFVEVLGKLCREDPPLSTDVHWPSAGVGRARPRRSHGLLQEG